MDKIEELENKIKELSEELNKLKEEKNINKYEIKRIGNLSLCFCTYLDKKAKWDDIEICQWTEDFIQRWTKSFHNIKRDV